MKQTVLDKCLQQLCREWPKLENLDDARAKLNSLNNVELIELIELVLSD